MIMRIKYFILAIFYLYACGQSNKQKEPVTLEHPYLKLPEPINKPIVKLPDSLKSKGTSGKVVLKCLIDTLGFVKEVNILETSDEKLNAIAIEIAKKYRFSPAEQNGKKVNFLVVIPINFSLSNEKPEN